MKSKKQKKTANQSRPISFSRVSTTNVAASEHVKATREFDRGSKETSKQTPNNYRNSYWTLYSETPLNNVE